MKFGYYIIYGNPKKENEDIADDVKAFAENVKKYNLELIASGWSFGTDRNYVLVLKGTVTAYESMFPDLDFPIKDRITHFIANM